MKIKNIKFNNHKILGNLEVDFLDRNKEILDTVVIIGENGSGKTTLLKSIYNQMNWNTKVYEEVDAKVEIDATKDEIKLIANTQDGSDIAMWNEIKSKLYINEFIDEVKSGNEYSFQGEIKSKIIYMPTEINFNELNRVDRTFKYEYEFLNEVNQNIARDLPSAIVNAINTEVFKNEDLPPKKSIEKICNDINSIFDCMDLSVKFIGLSKDEETRPIFKDSTGNEFDINGLSSGEKQLFIRALSLKFLNANNSIILIDEPEISLHPEWQRKIIKVYENIGKNNQLIIATHSPHIVADIKAEQLRVIKRDEDGVSITPIDNLEETYLQTYESILKHTMGIKSNRSDTGELYFKILRNELDANTYESDAFKEAYRYLKTYLGEYDKDLISIDMEIARRNRKKAREDDKSR